jgi:hypothetical protein
MVCGMDASGCITELGRGVSLRGIPCQRCKSGVAPTYDTYCPECRHVIDTVNAHYAEQQAQSRAASGLSESAAINRRALGIATSQVTPVYSGECNACGEVVNSSMPGTVNCVWINKGCKGRVKLYKRTQHEYSYGDSDDYSVIAEGGPNARAWRC